MKEFELKYGCNPNQKPARVFMKDDSSLPFEILNGRPGYINFLDAFNSWQLVREVKAALGKECATSFKHVSPTSASLGRKMSKELMEATFVSDMPQVADSEMATAYARARGTDRMSSFGDFVALSGTCDEETASILAREVSDGIIAPDYTPKALEILKAKKKGSYNIIKMDKDYIPEKAEHKDVFGITFEQGRNDYKINEDVLHNIVTENKQLTAEAIEDLIIALITLKYTQSNSVCFAFDGQAIGVGAGQQSRIHCTRLAAGKADLWNLRQNPRVLELPFLDELPRAVRDNAIDNYLGEDQAELLADGNWQKLFKVKPNEFTRQEQREFLSTIKGVSLGSDAFFPFDDNIERAFKSGVSFVAEPGGSVRDDIVIEAMNKHNMVGIFTGMRLFHH